MKTIVVGVDGSETAARAARAAVDIARATGAQLRLVTVATIAGGARVGAGSDEMWVDTADVARGKIEKLVSDLGLTSGYEIIAVPGNPAEVLVAEAEAVGAELLVVGNKRMQGVGRILGSVGNDVLHKAPCNVLVVKTT